MADEVCMLSGGRTWKFEVEVEVANANVTR